MSALLDAALSYAARGWPVLPCARKIPRAKHGVKDASTDPDVIRGWWTTWPLADVGLATGAPGPQVVDIDAPKAVPQLVAALDKLGGPCAATARGLHYYCAGTEATTTKIDGGEVRGRGSYVVCPPSRHPSGKTYVWLQEPGAPLPAVPAALRRDGRRAGRGALTVPATPIAAGEGRHNYLLDWAIRLARAGVLDEERLEAHLRLEFELSCESEPPPAPDFFSGLVRWATGSDIAAKERRAADALATWRARRARGV